LDQPTDRNRSPCPALKHLRAATADLHERLEERMNAVTRLSDDASRADLVRRYAALHIPAEAALGAELEPVADLDFASRRRKPRLPPMDAVETPAFPSPRSRAEALGMLYVLEGSTLGGKVILRELAGRGVDTVSLAFLDPYGRQAGERWRGFISVLDREIGDDAVRLEQAGRGAQRAFRHAEAILCGGPV